MITLLSPRLVVAVPDLAANANLFVLCAIGASKIIMAKRLHASISSTLSRLVLPLKKHKLPLQLR